MYPYHNCPFCSLKLFCEAGQYTICSCFNCISGEISKYKVTYKDEGDEPFKCEFVIDDLYIFIYFNAKSTTIYKLVSNTLLKDPISVNTIIYFDLYDLDSVREKLKKYILMI